MELKPGLSALVTGGASGIGKALSLAFSRKGIFVTVVDFSEESGKEIRTLLENEISKFYPETSLPLATYIKCDVTNASETRAAFERHLDVYGGLDICINSAGINSSIPFHKDNTDGFGSWRRTIDVNLIGVICCTQYAIQAMRRVKKPGVIINIGSASGLYPMTSDPIYSSSKGGVVMFTRSLAPMKREGIRVNVLCPEFVETELSLKVSPRLIDSSGGFLPMEMVVNGAFELILDETKSGSCLWITKRRGLEYWPTPDEENKYLLKRKNYGNQVTGAEKPLIDIPLTFEKIVVHSLSHNFRKATMKIQTELKLPVKPQHILVKIVYAGVNASDVNFSSGRYFRGSSQEASTRLPFDAGFEAVGLVAALGESVHDIEIGSSVAIMANGSYAEFVMVPSKFAIPVPKPEPEIVALLTSGLTASISLEKAGRMESGETVLVTAAAGGTGQFAVQLAKLAGNRVIATCGGEEKAALLNSLGVDRVIDYKKENLKQVLKKEFPQGVDIIYESVGGKMFDTCLNALAVHGRMIVIGMISQYQGESGWQPLNYTGLCEKILAKSQTVAGFFLPQYAHLWKQHMDKLFNLYSTGKLKVAVDPCKFVGLGSVADAVEYLHLGKSIGKVVVCVDPTFSRVPAKL